MLYKISLLYPCDFELSNSKKCENDDVYLKILIQTGKMGST